MDQRPERNGCGRRHPIHQDRDAEPLCVGLERVQERPDRLDVIPDMSDEGDVHGKLGRPRRIGRRPTRLDRLDVFDGVVLGDLTQTFQHGCRGVESDDAPAGRVERPRQRQRKPASAGTDIQPGLTGPMKVEQGGKDGIVPAGRVRPEERVDRRIEVRPVGHLADPFHLLAIGPNPIAPHRFDESR